MEMQFHLDSNIFELVKNGTKDIEVRINDEKRRNLHIGDTLVFLKRPHDDEKLVKKVTSLEYYQNFIELVDHYEMKRLYLDEYSQEQFLELLHQFYTQEEQEEFGVVAIGFADI